MKNISRWRLVTLIALSAVLYFFVNIQRAAVPGALFNQLQKAFGLTPSGVAALGSGFTYVYAAAQLVVGFLIGKFGWVKTVRIGGFIFAAGAMLFPFAGYFPAAYAFRILTGIGAGCLYLSIVQMTMEAFAEKFSMAIGIILIAGFTGGVVANAPLIAAEQIIGWENVLKLIAFALALIYIVWCIFSVGVTPSEKEASGKFGSLKEVISKRGNWYICVFNWVNFGLFYVVQTVIGKKYLEDFANMTPSRAALVFSVTGAIAAFSGVTQAYLSSLFGGRKAVFCRIATLVSFIVLGGQVVMLALGRGGWVCAVLFCLLAATATMSALTIPLLRNINTGSNFGLAVGLMNFGNYMAVALFGDLAGFLVGLFPATVINGVSVYGVKSYIALFAVLMLFLIPSVTCAWLIRDKKQDN